MQLPCRDNRRWSHKRNWVSQYVRLDGLCGAKPTKIVRTDTLNTCLKDPLFLRCLDVDECFTGEAKCEQTCQVRVRGRNAMQSHCVHIPHPRLRYMYRFQIKYDCAL